MAAYDVRHHTACFLWKGMLTGWVTHRCMEAKSMPSAMWLGRKSCPVS